MRQHRIRSCKVRRTLHSPPFSLKCRHRRLEASDNRLSAAAHAASLAQSSRPPVVFPVSAMSLKVSCRYFYAIFRTLALCSKLELPFRRFLRVIRGKSILSALRAASATTNAIRPASVKHRSALTQTDTHPQFWLPGEDVDQPRHTSFGSVQGIG